MDNNLLCEEVWLSNSTAIDYSNIPLKHTFYTTKEDSERAFFICLEKEQIYLPKQGFFNQLLSRNLIFPRVSAIQWFIKCCSRFNLSFVTLFNAANYFDRFISMSHCHNWKNWMVELLSVACLSVASKFSETFLPPLQEIQIDLDHTFKSITIQRMELMVLNALGWRLSSTTSYSYVELMMSMNTDNFLKSYLQKDSLVARVTELLLATILGTLQNGGVSTKCRAISAIWCSLEELIPSKSDAYLAYITRFLDQNQKEDIAKCRHMMEQKLTHDPIFNLIASTNCPSSPVTVLFTGQKDVCDAHVDFSLLKPQSNSNLQSNKKRRKQPI